MWVVDVSMCLKNVKKKSKITSNIEDKPLTLFVTKNIDTFFACYLYVTFFSKFLLSRHRTQYNFYLSTTHICICMCIYIYIYDACMCIYRCISIN